MHRFCTTSSQQATNTGYINTVVYLFKKDFAFQCFKPSQCSNALYSHVFVRVFREVKITEDCFTNGTAVAKSEKGKRSSRLFGDFYQDSKEDSSQKMLIFEYGSQGIPMV